MDNFLWFRFVPSCSLPCVLLSPAEELEGKEATPRDGTISRITPLYWMQLVLFTRSLDLPSHNYLSATSSSPSQLSHQRKMTSNNLENAGEAKTEDARRISKGTTSNDEMSVPEINPDTLARLRVARALSVS